MPSDELACLSSQLPIQPERHEIIGGQEASQGTKQDLQDVDIVSLGAIHPHLGRVFMMKMLRYGMWITVT
jgi:hypothetical protein